MRESNPQAQAPKERVSMVPFRKTKPVILFWTDSPVVSTGFGKVAEKNIMGLLATGKYQIVALGMNDKGYWHPMRAIDPENFIIEPLPYIGEDPYGAHVLPEILAKYEPDVVISVNDIWVWTGDERHPGMNDWVFKTLKSHKPYVPWIGYFPVDGRPWDKRWVNLVNNMTFAATFTDYGYETLRNTKDLDFSKVHKIYHGHDHEHFYPLDKSEWLNVRTAMDIPEDAFVIGFIARNQPRKDIPSALQAFKLFIDGYKVCDGCGHYKPIESQFPDCEICGSTGHTEIVEGINNAYLYLHMNPVDPKGYMIPRVEANLNLRNVITMRADYDVAKGMSIEDLNRIYNSCDVIVNPAVAGGYELAVAEALAVGKPVIATRSTSMTEQLADGRGHIVNPATTMIWEDANHCLAQDVEIYTLSGLKKIQDVHIGEKVLTHTGNYENVVKTFIREVDEEILDIQLSNNNESCQLTANHPILVVKNKTKLNWYQSEKTALHTINGSEYRVSSTDDYPEYNGSCIEWIPAEDLEEGDLLLLPKIKTDNEEYTINILNYISDKDFIFDNGKIRSSNSKNFLPTRIKLTDGCARLFGYFISEGCADGTCVKFSFSKDELNYAKDVQELIMQSFGLKSNVSIKTKSNGNTWIQVKVSSSILSTFFQNYFKRYSHERIIPTDIIQNISRSQSFNLLKGLISGDGTITSTGAYSYSTISRQLAFSMRLLATKLDTSVSVQLVKEKRPDRKNRYYITFSGKSLDKITSEFNSQLKDGTLNRRSGTRRQSFCDENYIYHKVVSISKIKYTGNVYNLTVDVDNSYVTPYFIVHNCFKHIIDKNKFVDALRDVYFNKERENSPELVEKRINFAKSRSWSDGVKQFEELIDRALQERESISDYMVAGKQNLVLGYETDYFGGLVSMIPALNKWAENNANVLNLGLCIKKEYAPLLRNLTDKVKIIDYHRMWIDREGIQAKNAPLELKTLATVVDQSDAAMSVLAPNQPGPHPIESYLKVLNVQIAIEDITNSYTITEEEQISALSMLDNIGVSTDNFVILVLDHTVDKHNRLDPKVIGSLAKTMATQNKNNIQIVLVGDTFNEIDFPNKLSGLSHRMTIALMSVCGCVVTSSEAYSYFGHIMSTPMIIVQGNKRLASSLSLSLAKKTDGNMASCIVNGQIVDGNLKISASDFYGKIMSLKNDFFKRKKNIEQALKQQLENTETNIIVEKTQTTN